MVLFHEYHSLSELGATMSDIAGQLNEAAKKATRASAQAEAWVNGPAGSFVETDSGQVPTIAELTRQNQEALPDVISYAGQAAASAGQAAASAALAGGIVEAAALPLPDVWAPLSDSLRMITGYGRDVLVGSDVVARMVNFSRNSAATYLGKSGGRESSSSGEARFATDGVLLEPASSNYITTSEGLSQIGTEAGSSVVSQNGYSLVNYTGTGSLSKDYSAPASTALTLSFYVRIGTTGTTVSIQTRNGAVVGLTATLSLSSSGVLSVTNNDNIASSWGTEPISASLVRVFVVIKPSTTTIYRVYRGAPVAGETFGSFQLEPLPFATSYIQTSGAVTTRAADSSWLPSSGNRFYNQYFSVSFTWRLTGIRTDIADNRLIDFDNDASSNRQYVGVSQSGKLVAQFGTNRIVSSASFMGGTLVLVVNGATFSLYNNGVKLGEAAITGWSGSPSGKISLLSNNTGAFQSAGVIRDIKMYHRALSGAQAKAIR